MDNIETHVEQNVDLSNGDFRKTDLTHLHLSGQSSPSATLPALTSLMPALNRLI